MGKHSFLLYYLVARDFKVKYRRSFLGVLWSILNPLLMMLVMSSVFSYVFRFDIDNFPVYLILGQVSYGFLSESTTMAMSSILGSASLIKKVYIPKHFFAFEKVIFSFINFTISFVAVAVVLIVYKIQFTFSILFLPLFLLYLFVFCLGIGFFLSSAAVFFRDILHLYNVLLTAWAYLTPIFYPIEALSAEMQAIMQLNPMYHYITYLRDIVLYGVAPSFQANLICAAFSLGAFVIGISFFSKNKDKFILHI